MHISLNILINIKPFTISVEERGFNWHQWRDSWHGTVLHNGSEAGKNAKLGWDSHPGAVSGNS